MLFSSLLAARYVLGVSCDFASALHLEQVSWFLEIMQKVSSTCQDESTGGRGLGS
jgi:hypothetical protein